MKINDFIEPRNVDSQAVRRYISRHPDIFNGHVTKNGKELDLDEVAIHILEEQYPLPKPVTVIQGVDPEEYERLREQLSQSQESVITLQSQLLQSQQQILQLSDSTAKVQLLEESSRQKEEQLQTYKDLYEETKSEVDRLRSRGLLDRIFNR